jgi:type III secretion protein D
MKSLRILTGHHAGVQTQLRNSSNSVGNDEAADIQITDWKCASVIIEINGENQVNMLTKTEVPNNTDTLNVPITMFDFMPHRFGDIVFCIGPTADKWPSDLSILGKLAWPKTVTRKKFSAVSLTAGSIIAAALVMLSAIASDSVRPVVTAKLRATASLLAQVENALAISGTQDLSAREFQGGVQINGVVADSTAAIRLRAALDQLDSKLVFHRYVIATDIIRAINEAVGAVSVQSSYIGAGVFKVTGRTTDIDRLLATIQRIKSDLGSQITRIDVDVIDDVGSKTKHTSAVMVSGEIQYVEAINGTKHFSIITPSGKGDNSQTPTVELSPVLSTSPKNTEP